MKFGTKINSAMMFIFAILFFIGLACESSTSPPVSDVVDSGGYSVLVSDGPYAWQSPTTCIESGLQGTEWKCAEDYLYTCIFEVSGKDCTTIKCGERWTDDVKNLVWIGEKKNQFTHNMSDGGSPSKCEVIHFVAGTVHTTGFGFWKNQVIGSYTTPSVDGHAEKKKAMVTLSESGDSSVSKSCCKVGDAKLFIIFQSDSKPPVMSLPSALCVPNQSTGFDLYSPNCDNPSTAYVKHSVAGFTDCPNGGHVKIVVKEDDGYGVSFSYTLCKSL